MKNPFITSFSFPVYIVCSSYTVGVFAKQSPCAFQSTFTLQSGTVPCCRVDLTRKCQVCPRNCPLPGTGWRARQGIGIKKSVSHSSEFSARPQMSQKPGSNLGRPDISSSALHLCIFRCLPFKRSSECPSCLPDCLPASLPSCRPACLPPFFPPSLPPFLSSFLPPCLPASLPSFLLIFPFITFRCCLLLIHACSHSHIRTPQ